MAGCLLRHFRTEEISCPLADIISKFSNHCFLPKLFFLTVKTVNQYSNYFPFPLILHVLPLPSV